MKARRTIQPMTPPPLSAAEQQAIEARLATLVRRLHRVLAGQPIIEAFCALDTLVADLIHTHVKDDEQEAAVLLFGAHVDELLHQRSLRDLKRAIDAAEKN